MNIPENFDRWMFDYKEGNLSGAEQQAFENFLIQHPEFELDADAWNNAFIENESYTYPQSNQLKKDNKVVGLWFTWAAASAAVIALLIGGSYFLTPDSTNQTGALKPTSTNENFSNLSLRTFETTNETTTTDNLTATNDGAYAQSLFASNVQPSINQINSSQVNSNQQNISHPENGKDDELIVGAQSGNAVNIGALNQSVDKIESDDFAATYGSNPEVNELTFDVAKNESYDFNSWQNKMKRFWNKVEDAFDIPPTNLTNLRDPDVLIPNSAVLNFNPGFAGGMTAGRFEMNYRNQWLGSDFNSQQMTVSYDKYVRKMKGGIGFVANVKDYEMGQFTDYNFSLIYSPKVMLGRNLVFEPAVKLTMGVLNGNGNTLPAESQFELERGRVLNTPAEPQMMGNQQLWYKDFGAGFMLNSNKFYAGVCVDNINRHFENVYNLEGYATPTYSPLLINAIVGLDFENDPVNGKKTISASPFLAYQNYGARQEVWGGLNLRFGMFTVGGSISQNIDYTASAGLKFEKFKLIYQYDHTYSTLANTQIGSHNIGIRFNGSRNKSRMNGPR
jgi:type IX secretion system PorP/SprF family membrane protein